MRQLVYTMFIINIRFTCAKRIILQNIRISTNIMMIIVLKILILFMSLVTTKLVKNSHTYARIVFIFLKNVLNQTWNYFNTKFQPQWEYGKSSYQVMQILGPFWPLHCCNFTLKQCERPSSYENVTILSLRWIRN